MNEYFVKFYLNGRTTGTVVVAYSASEAADQVRAMYPEAQIILTRLK